MWTEIIAELQLRHDRLCGTGRSGGVVQVNALVTGPLATPAGDLDAN
jgi:hypothetical protein